MLGYGRTLFGAAVCGVRIYMPSRVGNHDNAWDSYSELAPIQFHGCSLNSKLYLLLITYIFILEWFGTYN